MSMNGVEQDVHVLCITREVEIAAPMDTAFAAILEELGPGGELPTGERFPMILEAWPGGRWYRDRGDDAGHFWGHVQVIKPPRLLELIGPMFMSFPASNHVQYRLEPDGAGTLLKLTHRSMGPIPAEMRGRIGHGWEHRRGRIGEVAKRLAAEGREGAKR